MEIAMRPSLLLILLAFVVGAANANDAPMAAEGEGPDRKQATPDQHEQAILEQDNAGFQEYATAFREAKLPADREKAIREKYPRPGTWAPKFLELAEKNPRQPFAEEALIWIMTSEA